ncbi:MoaD/ThiS family protein [Pelotomaculum propionicicum]|uniref:MoaD/ThiS family protein n=1 Tax=Pelotomaculum propionicicum TaxID=258475 RepID=UPI003B79FDD4
MDTIEVRGFGDIKKLFEEREWSQPIKVELEEEISAADLAAKLDIPFEKIEIIFVNGKASPFGAHCLIKPGDRVAYVPPGTPGPYRVLLGFKNEDKK